jgi:hypothetical protein
MCETKEYRRMILEFLVWFFRQPFLSSIRSAYTVSVGEDKRPEYILGWGVWGIIQGMYKIYI